MAYASILQDDGSYKLVEIKEFGQVETSRNKITETALDKVLASLANPVSHAALKTALRQAKLIYTPTVTPAPTPTPTPNIPMFQRTVFFQTPFFGKM